MPLSSFFDNSGQMSEPTPPTPGSAVKVQVAFQLASRILTFIMNLIILRLTSPAVLGVSGVKLDMFIGTSLYLARDGLRMALIRLPRPADAKGRANWNQQFFNMAWLSVPLGLAIASLMTIIYVRWPPSDFSKETIRAYHEGISLYGISTLVELLIEPILSFLIFYQHTKKRLVLDLIGSFLKMSVPLTLLLRRQNSGDLGYGIRAFAFGQLARSLFLFISYTGLFLRTSEGRLVGIKDMVPGRNWNKSTIQHAYEMTKQLILKYALAQGDMWVISVFCRISDQGIYSVVMNYGSLICRLILQPLEDTGLQFFSRTLAGAPSEQTRKTAIKYLELILKFYTLLSLGLVTIAPWYTNLFVNYILGGKWSTSNMAKLLSMMCYLIPCMAFCGILEAFMNSTIKQDWYKTTRIASLGFSFVYIGLAVVLVKSHDTPGLMAASCLSFSLRALLGWAYLRSYLKPLKMRLNLLPSYMSMAVLSISGAVSYVASLNSAHVQVATGLVIAGIVAKTLQSNEQVLFSQLRTTYISTKKDKLKIN